MKKIRYGKCKQKPGPKSLNQKQKSDVKVN